MRANALNTWRWRDDVDMRVVARTDTLATLVFRKQGISLTKLTVPVAWVESLVRPEQYLGSPAQPALEALCERALLEPTSSMTARVQIFSDAVEPYAVWHMPCARPLDIWVLCGDEDFLASQSATFVGTLPPGAMVAFVRITVDHIEISPLRFLHERAVPVTALQEPSYFFQWRARLDAAQGALKDLFSRSLGSTDWYALTARGCRMAWAWQESAQAFRVKMLDTPAPPNTIPLILAQAKVEDSLPSAGTGTTFEEAKRAAVCEAWERFCLDRPDLADGGDGHAPWLKDDTGIYWDYLRAAAGTQGPSCRATTLCTGKVHRMPISWVYLQGSVSPANTNGAAFGTNMQDAQQAARAEVIERHALMQAYLGLSASRRLPKSRCDPNGRMAHLAGKTRQVVWYDLGRINGLHVVACCLFADSPPFATLGAAARSSTDEAATKAFFEAASVETMWAHKITRYGPRGFVSRGIELLKKSPASLDMADSGWIWAADAKACEKLDALFNRAGDNARELAEDKFVGVHLGRHILRQGACVKVCHPDALPLPSCQAHTQMLATLLDIPTPPPVPMT